MIWTLEFRFLDELRLGMQVESTQPPSSPPISVEQPDFWIKVLTKNQKKKLKKQVKAVKKINFLKENSASTSSLTSPDSTLASHTKKSIESKTSDSVIPSTHQALKEDKGLAGSKKRTKLQNGLTETNNLIITGYQPEQKESSFLLDLIVYDIPAKWSNYELLSNLDNWDKVVSVSTQVQKKYLTARV
ncbi:hypothetical protein GLOIN_2v1690538 [Rhizophagus clarus]|uniref:Uncharacterized protein n=1 Tax=Rhizophagus clarus TaxID=94130 RepID=A0A8H3QG56_9GLOM|nr:hypothetical protein GLOIN_2v1690538 [Rhizophagus clarus]